MLLYTKNVPMIHVLLTGSHPHSQKTNFTTVSSIMSTYSSSFRLYIGSRSNLNKSLEPIPKSTCKYFLYYFFSTLCNILYSQFILLTHSRIQPTYDKILMIYKCIVYAR